MLHHQRVEELPDRGQVLLPSRNAYVSFSHPVEILADITRRNLPQFHSRLFRPPEESPDGCYVGRARMLVANASEEELFSGDHGLFAAANENLGQQATEGRAEVGVC